MRARQEQPPRRFCTTTPMCCTRGMAPLLTSQRTLWENVRRARGATVDQRFASVGGTDVFIPASQAPFAGAEPSIEETQSLFAENGIEAILVISISRTRPPIRLGWRLRHLPAVRSDAWSGAVRRQPRRAIHQTIHGPLSRPSSMSALPCTTRCWARRSGWERLRPDGAPTTIWRVNSTRLRTRSRKEP